MVQIWEESREEEISADGTGSITRTLRVDPYTDRLTVAALLMGGVEMIGGRLVRTPPAGDPWYPWFRVSGVKTTPWEVLNSPGTNTGLAMLTTKNYSESARMVVTYSPPDRPAEVSGQQNDSQGNEDQEKEVASESWDYSSAQRTHPNQYWKFNADNIILPQVGLAVSTPIPKMEYGLVRHYVMRVPHKAITALLSRVNKSPFRTPRYIFPPETLRFDGVNIGHKFTTKGTLFFELAYKFAVMPAWDGYKDDPAAPVTFGYVGFNRYFRPDKGWYEYPVSTADPFRKPFLLDEDVPSQTFNGREVKGMNLLFHPSAT